MRSGKGELSFELLNLNGIPSTVVDPRPLRLHRYLRKLQFGYYHRNAALAQYNSRAAPVNDAECLLPMHIRSYFELPRDTSANAATFCYPSMLADTSGEVFCIEIERARSACWTTKGLVHEDDEAEPEELEADAEEERTDAGEVRGIEVGDFAHARALVRGASVVVGMHPDQATEHIVDFCLRNRVPFAVVPCCVYRRQFLHRRHPVTGHEVSDYGSFIEYLMHKSSQIEALELDFEGKNVLLYFLAGRPVLSAPETQRHHIVKGVASAEHWRALSLNTKDCGASTAVSCKTLRSKDARKERTTWDPANASRLTTTSRRVTSLIDSAGSDEIFAKMFDHVAL